MRELTPSYPHFRRTFLAEIGYRTLAVYTGTSVAGLSAIAKNDDVTGGTVWSQVTFSATAGVTYRIAVDGYKQATQPVGTGAVTLNWTTVPANDNFANAQSIAGSSGTGSGSNVNATKETGEPAHEPSGNVGGASIWYSWTAPASGQATIDTQGSNFDTLLAVYTGTSVAGLSAIAKNDDVTGGTVWSQVTFSATAGVTYRIAVDGYKQATQPVGTGAVTLNWATVPANDCTEPPFSDVPTTHPFCPEIKWMSDQGISTGFGDGTYRPTIAVTRQAMSAFMARLAGATNLPACTEPPFSDVPTTHPFCPEIKWMNDQGISTGFDDGTYRPTIAVTRQAMSAFMYRLDPLLP